MHPGIGVPATGAVWAAPVPPVTPAVLGPRPVATEHPTEHFTEHPGELGAASRPALAVPAPASPPRPAPAARRRFVLPVPVGQIACWQVSLTLVGMTIGRPLPVAGPALGVATVLLAMTVLRVRERWLYQWAWHYARFRRRERSWHVPKEDGPRAALHLFAPDAAVSSTRLDTGDTSDTSDTAIVSRACGATAVLRPALSGVDPVLALPRPGTLVGEGTAVQLVFHGVAGGRRWPMAWVAVQAVTTPYLYEDDDLTAVLGAAVGPVLRELAGRGVRAAGLDRVDLLRTVASLTHAGEGRRDVRERWRSWRCGPVTQAAFRLSGWTALPDQDFRRLLGRLLTETTGAVVTVALSATGPETETATMRLAASSPEPLERSAKRLATVAAESEVRLVRLDGEHAAGIASVLPLGPVS